GRARRWPSFPTRRSSDLVRERILQGRSVFEGRPGASLPAADFEAVAGDLKEQLKREPTQRDIVSSLIYPKVFSDFAEHQRKFSEDRKSTRLNSSHVKTSY